MEAPQLCPSLCWHWNESMLWKVGASLDVPLVLIFLLFVICDVPLVVKLRKQKWESQTPSWNLNSIF
jgi:hypothetical protein